jgi:hypothetical protein
MTPRRRALFNGEPNNLFNKVEGLVKTYKHVLGRKNQDEMREGLKLEGQSEEDEEEWVRWMMHAVSGLHFT